MTDPLEAKDQGHRRKCSPKKKGLQKFFSGDLHLRKTKKDLRKVSGVFQQNFNGSKNSAVLEPRTEQFSRT